MKQKHYTLPELKEKYWEFKKKLREIQISSGTYTYNAYQGSGGGGGVTGSNWVSGGCGGTCTVYKDTVEDFILWLEEK